jgi:hypothetical protein
MSDTKTLFTDLAIRQPFTSDLTAMLAHEITAWMPKLDCIVAEMIVMALATNNVRGEHHNVQDIAEVWVWPVEAGIYVAQIEGLDFDTYAFLPDAQPATVEALVKRLCPMDVR